MILFQILVGCTTLYADDGIPISRLDYSDINGQLSIAYELWQNGKIKLAILEIEKQLEADSSLITDAAVILGGNYHLKRLTDNIYTDRVGGFSPSGNKLAYSQDTFTVRIDDGMFDWLEERNTGLAYYDFTVDKETTLEIFEENPGKPRFLSDTCILYIARTDTNPENTPKINLFAYDLSMGTTTTCFPFQRQSYCPYENGVIFYDRHEEAIVIKDLQNHEQDVLYHNESMINYRRPLRLIRNFCIGSDVIMFDAGESSYKSIYGISLNGSVPEILITAPLSFGNDSRYYPAAVNYNEFAYLVNYYGNIDIYYHKADKDYRLTFDGGDKYYLAVSPDGSKIAYSYRLLSQNQESYEIFMLDFSIEANIEDLMYRFKVYR